MIGKIIIPVKLLKISNKVAEDLKKFNAQSYKIYMK